MKLLSFFTCIYYSELFKEFKRPGICEYILDQILCLVIQDKFRGATLDPTDAFVDFCKIGQEWFPFSVVREYYVENGRLVYSGKRIVTLVSDQLGTVCFKMVAYKGIFLPELPDSIHSSIDYSIIESISQAIKLHSDE